MDPDLTIVLLGRTGVGKSASANTILGRAAFESKTSFKAVTTGISEETGRVFGKLIRVVDTPGVLGWERQLRKLCGDVLRSSTPHLFLLVLSVGRFTVDQEEALRAAVNAVGPRGLEKSFLLLTGGDLLKDRPLEDFVREGGDGSFSEIVGQFEEAYHLFNNKDGGREQVRELLLKAGHLHTGKSCGAELRMVLVGRTGVGKSAAGNTILGRRVFRSAAASASITSVCQKETSLFAGQTLTVVDTPPLFDTCRSQEESEKEIAKCVSLAAPGPHVILVVIWVGRFTEEDKETLRIIQQMFGEEVAGYTMVLFTGGDHLEADGVTIEDIITKYPALHDFIRQCGRRYHVFKNRSRDPAQVRELLKKINTMVQRNRGRCYSTEMFRAAERRLLERESLEMVVLALRREAETENQSQCVLH
ncbi:GTPase IMAP family member 8-like [Neolamprologus brichardi]|uniref:GTPase IMAP family member 8-like n=1 Tax=Neolamprologus brichardi TaxID=32507 RepID=UPI001643BA2F|nr:GTPase IMAP family member 8-like [Neolamprologus brichardi]